MCSTPSSRRCCASRRRGRASRRARWRRSRRGTGCAAASCAGHSSAAPAASAPTARCSWTPAPPRPGCAKGTSSSPELHFPPMLLVLNVNNSETKIGLYRGEQLEAHWRLTTHAARTPDEWGTAVTAFITQAGRSTQEVRAAILASVVPPVTQAVCDGVEIATTRRPVVVDGHSRLPITLDVDEPLTVGADRILNTIAAARL